MEPLISVTACHGWHAALCLDELQSCPVTEQPMIVIKYGKMGNISGLWLLFIARRVQNYANNIYFNYANSIKVVLHKNRSDPEKCEVDTRENTILLTHMMHLVGSNP